MSDDNTQGAAEPSLASAGSHGDGMVARLRSWRDERGYPTPGEMLDEAADEIARLRLTEEEKKGIDGIIRDFQVIAEFNEERCHPHYAQKARCRVAMLSGLLKRLG